MDQNLSLYALNLELLAKMRYLDKINGGDNSNYKFPDPYIIVKDFWKDDIKMWPPVVFADVFIYLKNCNNAEYDEETLKNYKSLESFKYVIAGKVQRVLIYMQKSNGYSLLTAEVQPSQNTNDPNHLPWTIVKDDGQINAAHCTCMAGLGEACSHVAALLFKIQLGKARYDLMSSPTDLPCEWNSTFSSKKVICTTVDNLDISKSHWMQTPKRSNKRPVSPGLPPYSKTELENLKKAFPDSIYASMIESDSSSTDTGDEDEEIENMPPTLLNVVQTYKGENLKEMLMKIFTEELCKIIQNKTVGQSTNPLWFAHRQGRFTSSKFKEILRRKKWNDDYTSKLLHNNESVSAAAIDWGRNNETTALDIYTERMLCQHTNFQVKNCGLFINPSMPHLAATPDGLCRCDCCEDGIIEIKCPYKHRNVFVKDITDKDFCLDAARELKKNHLYYYQIQGQLAITEREFCDFVVWTTVDMNIQRIYRQPDFWDEHKQSLEDVFYSTMVPFIQKTSNS